MSGEGSVTGRSAVSRRRRVLGVLIVVLVIALAWVLIKFLAGDPWRIDGQLVHNPPFRWKLANDQSLPHIWQVFGTMTRPIQPGGPALASLLFDFSVYTARGAALGFALGAGFGLSLGILLAHVRVLELSLIHI